MSTVRIITRKGVSIYLMEVADFKLPTYLEGLTPEEMQRFSGIHHTAKKIEFAASRFLRTSIFGKEPIHYNSFGSPYLDQQGFISLSHTKGLVVMAHAAEFNIGVDVEYIRDKAVAVHRRFVNASEQVFFDTSNSYDMSLLWSFKEALYKLTDRKGVLFAKELLVRKEDDQYIGTILHHDAIGEYELFYETYGQYLITCSASKQKLLPVESI